MIFDYVRSVTDRRPQRCTPEAFENLTRMPYTAEMIRRFRAGDADAKKKLPAFCFHAHFGGKPRASKFAQPSGLVMADFDHLSAERLAEICEAVKRLANDTAHGIMLAHVTPSGKGVRVVFKAKRNDIYAGCESVSQYQQRLAFLCGAKDELDAVTTDMARLSFCPQASDIFFYTSALFSETPEVTEFADTVPTAAAQASEAMTAAQSAQPTGQSSYKDTPLTDIFARYFMLSGGIPVEGERNARFYSAARDLRYICDFNPHTLAAHMPSVGLSQEEVLSVCISACGSSRASRMPQTVQAAIAEVCDAQADDPPADAENVQQPLPVVMRPLVESCPTEFRDAALLALLPICGVLATGVRAQYIDGEIHSPSFMAVLTAEQASGKSFVRKFVEILLKDIREEDAAARGVEMAYRSELKKKKNAKDLPEPPRTVVRIVPASVSVAKLLQRLDYAEGKHLFSFAEELDTVIKSNSSGAWSQKSDIYRNAFDNAEYGQDYMNDDTYSAIVRVYYNLLFLGTPRQTSRFFKNVENGLVSRTCFATLPDQFGAEMPKFRKLTEDAEKKLARHIAAMRAYKGEVNLSFLHEPLAAWLERQRIMALEENNRARDIFRRRAAVIGFRAALCFAPCYVLSATSSRRMLQNFSLYVAEKVLEGQLHFAADELNAVIERGAESKVKSQAIFEVLTPTFTLTNVAAELHKRGMKTPAKALVYLWKRANLITAGEQKRTYIKTSKK